MDHNQSRYIDRDLDGHEKGIRGRLRCLSISPCASGARRGLTLVARFFEPTVLCRSTVFDDIISSFIRDHWNIMPQPRYRAVQSFVTSYLPGVPHLLTS